jgi:hypothetical protein
MTRRGKNILYTSSTWMDIRFFPPKITGLPIYNIYIYTYIYIARKQEGPQKASSRTYLPLLRARHALAWSSSIDHGSVDPS